MGFNKVIEMAKASVVAANQAKAQQEVAKTLMAMMAQLMRIEAKLDAVIEAQKPKAAGKADK